MVNGLEPRQRGWTALVLCYAAGLLVVSLLPASGETMAATGPLGVVAVDLWFHAGGYALFALLLARATGATTVQSLLAVLALVALYGLAIEGLQTVVATRQFSLFDALANTAGATVAVAVRAARTDRHAGW